MTKLFTTAAFLGLGFMASASVPVELDVTPVTTQTHSSIEEITIEYNKGSYADIAWYMNPDVRINNVPVSGTKSVSTDHTVITYTLDNPITATGEYTIFIGAQSFYYDLIYEYDNPDMSWTVNVQNDGGSTGFEPIENAGVDIIPAQGAYCDLQYFTLAFESSYTDINSTKTCSLIKDDGTNEVVATTTATQGSGLIYQDVNFATRITEPGTYILVCPEGTFYDMMTDEDYPEYRFRFEVKADAPSTLPAEDSIIATPAETETLPSLDEVIVTFVDYESVYNNSSCNEAITVTDADGNVVAQGETQIGMGGLAVNETKIIVTPAITTAGTYTLNVPYRTFILESNTLYNGQYSGPISLTYNVDPMVGIDAIETEPDADAKVYRIDGTIVKGELVPGLYIIDGKKVMVK